MTRQTKSQAEHLYYLQDVLERLEFDLHNTIHRKRRIPSEWHDIYRKRDRERSRITLRVDRDVLKFFRSMGPGYQPRMNNVLRAFMEARLAGLIDGGETITAYRQREHARADARPEFGDFARLAQRLDAIYAESDERDKRDPSASG